MSDANRMTKAERADLHSLIKKRERVLKTAAEQRSAELLAEFERQSATIYNFDDDQVWETATREAKVAVEAAAEKIAEQCAQMGIPKEFAPTIYFGWTGRGQNAVKERRDELRRAAKARIAALEAEAKAKIEKMSLDAQLALVSSGIESDAARAFIEAMPTVEVLMPTIDARHIKAIVDAKAAEREARWGR